MRPSPATLARRLRFIGACHGIGWVVGMVFISPLLHGHRHFPFLVDLALNSVIGVLISTFWFAVVHWWSKKTTATAKD